MVHDTYHMNEADLCKTKSFTFYHRKKLISPLLRIDELLQLCGRGNAGYAFSQQVQHASVKCNPKTIMLLSTITQISSATCFSNR